MLSAIEASALAEAIRRSAWAYPALEIVHIAGFANRGVDQSDARRVHLYWIFTSQPAPSYKVTLHHRPSSLPPLTR